jgi:hypothetical protein
MDGRGTEPVCSKAVVPSADIGLAKMEALSDAASPRRQQAQLFRRLDTFGNHLYAEHTGQSRRVHDSGVVRIRG